MQSKIFYRLVDSDNILNLDFDQIPRLTLKDIAQKAERFGDIKYLATIIDVQNLDEMQKMTFQLANLLGPMSILVLIAKMHEGCLYCNVLVSKSLNDLYSRDDILSEMISAMENSEANLPWMSLEQMLQTKIRLAFKAAKDKILVPLKNSRLLNS
ncbi:MAG: hypothetical protein LBF22_06920 [Deltaproteobacteria bacterium]|jgi:hypothetical protein|nr:hypothetical protein [Deltaproteobacteria bacterium]